MAIKSPVTAAVGAPPIHKRPYNKTIMIHTTGPARQLHVDGRIRLGSSEENALFSVMPLGSSQKMLFCSHQDYICLCARQASKPVPQQGVGLCLLGSPEERKPTTTMQPHISLLLKGRSKLRVATHSICFG